MSNSVILDTDIKQFCSLSKFKIRAMKYPSEFLHFLNNSEILNFEKYPLNNFVLASNGWNFENNNTLFCNQCDGNIFIYFPSKPSQKTLNFIADKLRDEIKTNHDENCIWRSQNWSFENSIAISFFKIKFSNKQCVFDFSKRVIQWKKILLKNFIIANQSEKFNEILSNKSIKDKIFNENTKNKKEKFYFDTQSKLLSLFNWKIDFKKGEKNNFPLKNKTFFIKCSLCFKKSKIYDLFHAEKNCEIYKKNKKICQNNIDNYFKMGQKLYFGFNSKFFDKFKKNSKFYKVKKSIWGKNFKPIKSSKEKVKFKSKIIQKENFEMFDLEKSHEKYCPVICNMYFESKKCGWEIIFEAVKKFNLTKANFLTE